MVAQLGRRTARRRQFAPDLRLRGRAVNRIGGALRLARVPVASLDESSLLEAAERETGLDDWGDERFRVPLGLLADSYDRDDLTFIGRLIARRMLVGLLANRLRVAADHARIPELAERPVRRPLFVVGLPRTGTTFLLNLLAQDPASRPLRYWESLQPSPPPRPGDGDDPRIERAERLVWMMNSILPGLRAIHDIRPRGPEECLPLLMSTFVTPFFAGPIPRYRAWLASAGDAELDRVYAEYRRQLQVLQLHDARARWLLKCPSHLFGLEALLRAFPDAAVVQTHRDPVVAVPSMASLSATLDGLQYRTVDPEEVGARTVEKLGLLVGRALAAREDRADPRVLDVHYERLVREPAAVVADIYERFGLERSDEVDGRVRAHLASARQHGAGVHRYRLEDFGLDRPSLERRFAAYYDRFGVERDLREPHPRPAATAGRRRPPRPPAAPAVTRTLRRGEVAVQYHDAGEGEAVVLLPGFGRAASELDDLAAGLVQAGYRTVAVELRGVGGSSGPRRPRPTLHDLAADVAAVVEDLSGGAGGPVHVVGRAFGNRVARCLAADRPDLVRSLVLLAAGGRFGPKDRIVLRYLAFGTPLAPRRTRERFERELLYAQGNEPEPGGRRRITLRAVAQQAHAALRTPLEEWWLGGSAPILVLQGEEDRVAPPANAFALRDDAPDRVEVVLLEHAGHALLPEQPERILAEIVSFLGRHPVAAA